MDVTSARTAIRGRRPLLALACGLALLGAALASSARAQGIGSSADLLGAGSAAAPLDAASLVQCQTASEPAERSATFSAEMTTIPGAVRMSMRIELLEWAPGDTGYRAVAAPGLGVWRAADPGVGVYRYVKQVTNLSAPAIYRGLVSFRWQGTRGRLLKREERRTRRCSQPGPPAVPPAPARSSSLE